MADTSQQSGRVVHHDQPTKHIHHGRTVAAWTGTTIAMVAFVLGGIAMVIPFWPLFWVAVALLVVALIATVVLQKMGHGAH